MLSSAKIGVSTGNDGYPSGPPYSPNVRYPEYPFSSQVLSGATNHGYEGVRDVLGLLELDTEHRGGKSWNPLGAFVRPGDTVVLKPNLIRHFRETQFGHKDCLMTHGAIIRATVDYVYTALKGEGRIIVADAPQNDADFGEIKRIAGLDALQKFYLKNAHFEVEVYDLRPEHAKKINGVIVGHDPLPGDPAGYVKVDLGQYSMFAEVEHLCHLLYGSEYNTNEICRHHTGGRHEYLISKTILDADCIINLPKLKTHKKTGITACMKNLVGINGNKNWLPHHRLGTPAQGGDQFTDDHAKHRIERQTMSCFRRVFPLLGPARKILAKPLKAAGQVIFGDTNSDTIRSGNWYGNDTTWRMVIDLNRILMYADRDGNFKDHPVRKIFNIVDGIVGGEGNGPLDPTPRQTGMVLAGMNSVAVDLACARLMGFNYERLPVLHRALDDHSMPIARFDHDEVTCASNDRHYHRPLTEFNGMSLSFVPHFGWRGHVELDSGRIAESRTRECSV
ncbi:MAG: hypothetical protein A2Z25_06125 [Planctomycetes bacterium RBG_16_55_9]|nr:MAG: hypothetical protein A2Z25_06125 [Planctomycetes bacterium RBG_16_55_9]